MFPKEQLEAIAEKLPQKTRRIEKYNDQLVMHVGNIFFEFYKQNHNRETDSQYVEATCPTCGGDWEPGLVSVEITFGNGDQYLYERYDDSVETHNLSDVIDYLFTHLDEFPTMTQRQFIEHLTDELNKRFRYIN